MNLKHAVILTIFKIFSQLKNVIFNGNSPISKLKHIYFYCLGDTEKRFACSSQGFPRENEIIKLYLFSDDLVRPASSTLQPVPFL